MTTKHEELMRAAQAGDVQAAAALANCYEAGEGVAQDSAQATYWYERAADMGSDGAAYVLGCRYRDGVGVGIDSARAVTWFERAAALGDPAAHMYLALVFTEGLLGQTKDGHRALEHMRLADGCVAASISKKQARRADLLADQ